jgi:zinc transport system substrate-binding protein
MLKSLIAVSVALVALTLPAMAAGPRIAVTITPLARIAQRIGGPDTQVFVILKPGQSPHGYEPTPGDMKKLAEADFVVLIGLGLDNWVLKMARAAGGEMRGKIVDLSEALDPKTLIGSQESGHGGHAEEVANPHYWLDPMMTLLAAKALAAKMAGQAPAGEKVSIEKRMAELEQDLTSLDAEIKETLKDARGGFVAFHGAWDYFARRYRLNQVGVIEASPGKNPSARHITQLVERIKKTGGTAVMAEPQFSPRLAQMLSGEAGVKLGIADPLGGAPGREDYFSLMRYNARAFLEALK